MTIETNFNRPLDLQEAYNMLLLSPTETILTTFNDGDANQSFEFVDPPSYTTAAKHGKKVMQEVRVYGLDELRYDGWPIVGGPSNHWGFLYPPDMPKETPSRFNLVDEVQP
jgi:hypothetical protein